MPVYDASGQADGVSTASGAAARAFNSGGTTTGTSTLVGPTTERQVAAGTAPGVATNTGATLMTMVLAGTVLGFATVTGDVNPQGGGTAAGTSTASGGVTLLLGPSGTAAGTSTGSATAGFEYIVSGFVYGQATVSGDTTTPAAGIAVGQATTTGDPIRIVSAKGVSLGTSQLFWSYPLPMRGTSSMAAHVVIESHLPAIRALVAPPKTFRYLQVLQRGDLPLYLCDRRGPVSPNIISFTLYQKRSDGTTFQVGPSGRVPAEGEVGEFYATGRAGESGQPGCWVIKWFWRRSFDGPAQTKEMEFRVEDAVLAADPRDTTVRVRKYGWN